MVGGDSGDGDPTRRVDGGIVPGQPPGPLDASTPPVALSQEGAVPPAAQHPGVPVATFQRSADNPSTGYSPHQGGAGLPAGVPVLAQGAGVPAAPARRGPKGGVGILAIILALGAATLATPALTTVWLRTKAHSTRAWESTLGSLHTEPGVAEPVADIVAKSIRRNTGTDVDTDEISADVEDDVRSDEFHDTWRAAIAGAHDQALAVAAGQSSDDVWLSLDDLAVELQKQGYDVQGEDLAEVIVLPGKYSSQVHTTSGLLDRAAVALPLLAALLAGGAVVAGRRNRLRIVAILSVAVAVVAGVSVVTTVFAPKAVVSAVASDNTRAAARLVTAALSSSLAQWLLVLMIVGLLTAAGTLMAERAKRAHQPPPVAWPGA